MHENWVKSVELQMALLILWF